MLAAVTFEGCGGPETEDGGLASLFRGPPTHSHISGQWLLASRFYVDLEVLCGNMSFLCVWKYVEGMLLCGLLHQCLGTAMQHDKN